jgi:hypothetical protein
MKAERNYGLIALLLDIFDHEAPSLLWQRFSSSSYLQFIVIMKTAFSDA